MDGLDTPLDLDNSTLSPPMLPWTGPATVVDKTGVDKDTDGSIGVEKGDGVAVDDIVTCVDWEGKDDEDNDANDDDDDDVDVDAADGTDGKTVAGVVVVVVVVAGEVANAAIVAGVGKGDGDADIKGDVKDKDDVGDGTAGEVDVVVVTVAACVPVERGEIPRSCVVVVVGVVTRGVVNPDVIPVVVVVVVAPVSPPVRFDSPTAGGNNPGPG